MSEFIRPDWTNFRSIGTLPMAAGVPKPDLKKLVAKELADNSLDASGECCVGLAEDGGLEVQDNGNGIAGTPEQIATLFSINRPLTSSKQLRLPLRGALGNGLRVVAGYALATGARLTVETRGQKIELQPQDDGTTKVMQVTECDWQGTRVTVHPGRDGYFRPSDLKWADRAIDMSGTSTFAGSGGSPFWFDEDAFWELCQAFGSGFIRDLVARLDGCANPKAGKITSPWKGRRANTLSRQEAADVLRAAREAVKLCKPERLCFIGPKTELPSSHAKAIGTFRPAIARGQLMAHLPFIVEAWAEISSEDEVELNVNRTPVAAHVSWERASPKTKLSVYGCQIGKVFDVGQKPVKIVVNVQTPFMPITSQGKAPNLSFMADQVKEVVEKAVRSAKLKNRIENPEAKTRDIIDIVRDVLEVCIDKASGNRRSRYSIRQLFYQVRPYILKELGKEPKFKWFSDIIGQIETERGGDLPKMYRDVRGVVYHPHTGQDIPLGTLNVERYKVPEWGFNKVLYCEKEGFFEILKDAQWPERHDCALLTSKGQPTRAARDLIDEMGRDDQELTFFCIHDADAAGTIIYQSLQDATKARPARKVKIINLGLEPEEALEMDLEPEEIDEEAKKKPRPVADYVSDEWARWLQENRVELNAMTSPQFIAWLDGKMEQHGGEKLVPPVEVLTSKLTESTREKLRAEIEARVLASANIEGQVNAALGNLNGSMSAAVATVEADTRKALKRDAARSWRAPINDLAQTLAKKALQP